MQTYDDGMLSMRRPQPSTTPVVPPRTVARGLGLVATGGVVGAAVGIVLALLDRSSGFVAWAALLGGATGLLVGATSVLGAATVLVLAPTSGPARSVGAALAAAVAGALTAFVVLGGLSMTSRGALTTAVAVSVFGAAVTAVRRYST